MRVWVGSRGRGSTISVCPGDDAKELEGWSFADPAQGQQVSWRCRYFDCVALPRSEVEAERGSLARVGLLSAA